MSFNEEYLKKLRNSGLRPTKQRIKICKALFNKEKTFHFNVNDLFKMIEIIGAEETIKRINKLTKTLKP